jgi:orotidine-5'-phosphate decarboxylase
MKKNPIIFAIDLNSTERSIEILKETHDLISFAKFGLEFFYFNGLNGLKKIISEFPKLKIFLDLKFYDIPTTVSKSLYSFEGLTNIELMTFHGAGGKEMFFESRKVLSKILPNTKILSVTKLTSFSLNEKEIFDIAEKSINNYLANGVICPAHMVNFLKTNIKNRDFITVTPGIRLENDEKNDQKTIMTPKKALDLGSDFLVIGRSIMNQKDKREFLINLLKDLNI